jgi:serine/threonine protein kinase
VTCSHCQTVLATDARFCPACGKAVQSTTPEPNASGPIRMQPEMIGREIVGRFRILAKLGEGGMGAVYRGEQISLKRAVAIKVLRPELSANQQLLRRFAAEAEAVAKLDHPNTVKVYDFGQDTDGSLFIAMELIEGRPLRGVLAESGAMPPARAFRIALQVAASLVDAHAASIVHRDLKPDNVMLVDRGRQHDMVRVLDFGIAKLRDDSRQTQNAMTQAGDMLGTPQYMAPEQIKGEAIDGRTDIYALGCMLYEMVTARLPFEAPTVMAMLSKHLLELPGAPSQRRPDLALSPAIDHVVMCALQKDPGARPPTMEVYAEMLAGVLAQLPSETPPPGTYAPSSAQAEAVFTPYPTPHPQAPPSYARPAPPPTYVTPGATRRGPARSVVLGAVLLAGGGLVVWAATRHSSSGKPAIEPEHEHAHALALTSDDASEGDDQPDPPTPSPHDPWGDKSASDPVQIGTRATPVPRGAHLNPPGDFTKLQDNADGQIYEHPSGINMSLGPLIAGTNDPMELATDWIRRNAGAGQQLSLVSTSATDGHPVIQFAGTVNGVSFVQYATLYITARYRIGYVLTAPATIDPAVLHRLLENGVTLP